VGDVGRVTYRSVLSNREFAAILCSQSLSFAGDQLARIAVALLVFHRTGSAYLAALTYAVSYLAYLVGGPLVSALADRNPRLTVMVVCDLARAPLVLVLCWSALPTWAVLTLLALIGALSPAFDSARSALQPDVLSGDAYVMGNALINMVAQVSQIAGFVLGGIVVSLTSTAGALGVDAATFVVSAGLLLRYVDQRPAAQAGDQRASFRRDTTAGLALVARTPVLRSLLLYAVLASAAVSAPEGLAVPAAAELGGGSLAAGVMTAAVPFGFLVASLLVLRVDPDRRQRLLPWLAGLSCLPLLLTPLMDSVAAVTALWVVSGAGATVNLIASSAFMQACPAEFRSRAYGVAAALLMAGQGGALLLSGVIADSQGARSSVAILAGLSLALLAPLGLARVARVLAPQGNEQIVRQSQG
jgi:MFS family permease